VDVFNLIFEFNIYLVIFIANIPNYIKKFNCFSQICISMRIIVLEEKNSIVTELPDGFSEFVYEDFWAAYPKLES